MNQQSFISGRKEDWERLGRLLGRLETNGVRSVSDDELESFGFLYRKTTSDLAYAKSRGFDPEVVLFLNDLVARTHPFVYTPPPAVMKNLKDFYRREFPRMVRERFAYVAIAAALFFGGTLLSYLFVLSNPYTARTFLPESLVDGVQERIFEKHTIPGRDDLAAEAMPMASQIMTNNIKVGIMAFAFGITFCAGTAWVLVQNGFMLGGLAGLFDHFGVGVTFWAYILPHGVLELTAIFISAASGLFLGYTLISPGDYTRADALKMAGPEAVRILFGTVPMYIVAGTIEGFFTPLPIADGIKIAFSGVVLLLTVGYFLL